jgi:NADPH2 dehydrogenase
MSRYFKYKTAADLVAGARELGQEIAVADSVEPLFQPLVIGGRTVGNRLVIHPMEGCDGTLDGLPGELTYRRYQRFGAGGAKLIWGEATSVWEEGRANSRQLLLADHTLSALERMLTECRQAHRAAGNNDGDLLVGLQLTHSGRYAFRKPILATHDPLLDPITQDKSTGRVVDASYPLISDSDLERLIDRFVEAARLVYALGYDFVDIKQCHRYLLSELLAAKNRPGPFGGSYENRTRLIREVVQRIRAEFPDKLIATRMNAYDGIPYRAMAETRIGTPVIHEPPLVCAWGTDESDHMLEDLEEPIRLVRDLARWGVGLINITLGNPYSNPHIGRPADYPPVDGYLPPEHPLLGVARHFRIAHALQAAVPEVALVGTGYSWLQEFAGHVAAANVGMGHIALAGFGRATLSHPDFAQALRDEGRFQRKKVCRTFSYCTGLMRAKDHPLGQYETGCPPFDKEVYGPVWKEVEAQRSDAT